MQHLKIAALLFIPIAMVSCSSSEPSKEIMIDNLRSLLAADQAGAGNEADYWLKPYTEDGSIPQGFLDAIEDKLDESNCSNEGIDVLEQRGFFGPLLSVFPDKGERWMERFGIKDPQHCYGLSYDQAEVAGQWHEGAFKFFRMDDAGSRIVD